MVGFAYFEAEVAAFNSDAIALRDRRNDVIKMGRSCGLKLSAVTRMLAKVKVVAPPAEPELPLALPPVEPEDAEAAANDVAALGEEFVAGMAEPVGDPDIAIPDYLRVAPKEEPKP